MEFLGAVAECVGEVGESVEGLTIFAMAEERKGRRKADSLRAAQGRLSPGLRPGRNDKANLGFRRGRNDNDREHASGRNAGRVGMWRWEGVKVTRKRLGEVAEAEFLARASGMGLGVARPWGDSNRYDFIVDAAGRLWRVQVKSAYRVGKNGSYSFRAYGHSGRAYRACEIDALVAYVVPEDAWYLFPVSVARRVKSLKLFPVSRRKRSKFEKWREAWWVVGCGGG